jgi:hypothetical protein
MLKVFWNDDASVVESAVLPGCSSLTALTYSSMADGKKIIALRLFIGSGSLNNR